MLPIITFSQFTEYSDKNITASRGFQGTGESNIAYAKLQYTIYYNRVSNPGYNSDFHTFSTSPKLLNPVIILDGFDPNDKRKTHPKSVGYNSDSKSIYEFMNVKDTSRNLVNELQNKGFDVILVNFANGADFIERNAYGIVSLLESINIELAANGSTKKNTIIGPSMGGLISRFALAYMEKNNITHNTRLWVSFDTPHHGANVPISVQAATYYLGIMCNNKDAKEKYIEKILSPAAKQMLIDHIDTGASTTLQSTSSLNNMHPFRQDFLKNQAANGLNGENGFPKNLRKVAISNGTSNGKRVVPVNTNLLSMNTLTIGDIVPDINSTINTTGFKLLNPILYTQLNQILSIPVFNLNCRSSANTGDTSNTFSGYSINKDEIKKIVDRNTFYVPFTYPALVERCLFGICAKVPGYKTDYIKSYYPSIIIELEALKVNNNFAVKGNRSDMNFNTYGSLDGTQGGTTDFIKSLNDPIVKELPELKTTYLPNQSFIPTASSLALKNPNFDWGSNFARNLSCNNETPFDSFYIPNDNQEHVSITEDVANWIYAEIEEIPLPIVYPGSENKIIGDDSICQINKSLTYTFQTNTSCSTTNSVTQWIVPPASLDIISSTSTSITVQKKASNIEKNVTIKAKLQNGNFLNKYIDLYDNISDPLQMPEGNIYIDDVDCDTNTIKFNFDPTTSFGGIITIDPPKMRFPSKVKNILLNAKKFTVTYINPCTGQKTQKIFTINYPNYVNTCTFEKNDINSYSTELEISTKITTKNNQLDNITPNNSIKIFPNPTKDFINITLDNATNTKIQAELYDLVGKKITTFFIANDESKFSVEGLHKGIYLLKIYITEKVETYRIIIN